MSSLKSGWSDTSKAKPSSEGDSAVSLDDEGVQPQEQHPVVAAALADELKVQVVVVGSLMLGVAAKRRRVEEDLLAGGEAVLRADALDRLGHPLGVEEEVRARDAQFGDELLGGLTERLGVRGDRVLRADQDVVVVRVDANVSDQLLARAEGLVENAVADLLEGAARVPGLDDGRPGLGRDDVDREEVVVDDEHARGREVVLGDDRLEQRRRLAEKPRPRIGEQQDRLAAETLALQLVVDALRGCPAGAWSGSTPGRPARAREAPNRP